MVLPFPNFHSVGIDWTWPSFKVSEADTLFNLLFLTIGMSGQVVFCIPTVMPCQLPFSTLSDRRNNSIASHVCFICFFVPPYQRTVACFWNSHLLSETLAFWWRGMGGIVVSCQRGLQYCQAIPASGSHDDIRLRVVLPSLLSILQLRLLYIDSGFPVGRRLEKLGWSACTHGPHLQIISQILRSTISSLKMHYWNETSIPMRNLFAFYSGPGLWVSNKFVLKDMILSLYCTSVTSTFPIPSTSTFLTSLINKPPRSHKIRSLSPRSCVKYNYGAQAIGGKIWVQPPIYQRQSISSLTRSGFGVARLSSYSKQTAYKAPATLSSPLLPSLIICSDERR